MPRILIAYATTEGQTRKIAEHLRAKALNYGFEPTIHDMSMPDIETSRFDCIIIAASVHTDRHQATAEAFVRRHLENIKRVPSAFLSVSLSAAGDAEDRYVAWEYLRSFLLDIGWRPTQTEIVAGALRFTEYDFFKRWMMKQIAKAKRMPRDPGCDYEYTDWEALTRFLTAFLTPLRPHGTQK